MRLIVLLKFFEEGTVARPLSKIQEWPEKHLKWWAAVLPKLSPSPGCNREAWPSLASEEVALLAAVRSMVLADAHSAEQVKATRRHSRCLLYPEDRPSHSKHYRHRRILRCEPPTIRVRSHLSRFLSFRHGSWNMVVKKRYRMYPSIRAIPSTSRSSLKSRAEQT